MIKMATIIFMLILLAAIILTLLFSYKKLSSKKTTWTMFSLITLAQFAILYGIAEIFRQIDIFLQKKSILIDLGHASLLLIITLFLSLIAGVVITIISLINRLKSK